MDIIALVGPSGCGKTTTLNITYSRLLQLGGVSTNKQQLGADPNDFSDIVLWKEKKIAFYTMGDYSTALIEAIAEYLAQNVDVLVCACNDRFVRPFQEFEKHRHTIISKTREPKGFWETANNTIAEQILNLL